MITDEARQKNRDAMRAWVLKNPEKAARSSMRSDLKRYGISIEEYEALLLAQNDVCAICKNPPTGNGNNRRLCVDHDHKTGVIRGPLCKMCNTFLGRIKDDPTTISSYLSGSIASLGRMWSDLPTKGDPPSVQIKSYGGRDHGFN
jgi:hypothetical protein